MLQVKVLLRNWEIRDGGKIEDDEVAHAIANTQTHTRSHTQNVNYITSFKLPWRRVNKNFNKPNNEY